MRCEQSKKRRCELNVLGAQGTDRLEGAKRDGKVGSAGQSYRVQRLVVAFGAGEIDDEVATFFGQFFFLLVQANVVLAQAFDVLASSNQIFGQGVFQSRHLSGRGNGMTPMFVTVG